MSRPKRTTASKGTGEFVVVVVVCSNWRGRRLRVGGLG